MSYSKNFKKSRLIYDGKSKRVYGTEYPDKIIIEFKDDLTAFNGKKHDVLNSKGELNAAISNKLFNILKDNGIETHFIKQLDSRSFLAKKLNMIPLEVVCRNIAYGSLLKRVPLFKAKEPLHKPVIEFFLKNDELGDPFLSEEHINYFNILNYDQIMVIKSITLKINEVLKSFLKKVGITLVDFKLEYGRDSDGRIILGDELTGDSMRLWDYKTGRVLDKDLYRMNKPLEEVLEGYRECYKRIVLEEVS